ncbi:MULTISPECIES: hypothetical protein [unclassified Paenibacillus]|uniref:hypothetical protein n=1 Tax=unclassified Paenibacillus TaxID=185978 RepID=UPI001AE9D4A1|nr:MULTISPECIES: hypothetical protein [unclassified Paenibacillus]MBP1156445.1 hypothetical protein [Paenibacillus sp. PvP091]MBP1168169.1 hypothetical protein [Paenibacillus sp. PvR098]MBP2439197.1 hypothetical protein [Paenibacillus sp. PvP052]
MNSTALSVEFKSRQIRKLRVLESKKDETRGTVSTEHDELGETVFYELSPIHMALYYAFDPEMDIS